MTRSQQPAVTAFAIGMIGLGVLALIYHDFAMVWQPVPDWIPGRTALAYAAGAIMLVFGIGLLFKSTAAWSIRILFPYLVIWMLLKLPALFVAPGMEAVWLGFGELAVLASGGWILFAELAELREGWALGFLTGKRALYLAQKFFGLWLIPVGLSHIFYVKATADLVPAWLPYRDGWAYLTGAGQMACGLGVLLSIFPRIAAFSEAAMIGCFTFLVWAPRIISEPKSRLNWTAFLISWTIGSAAWAVAQSIAAKHAGKKKMAATTN